MPDPDSASASSAPAPAQSLTSKAAGGFAWAAAQMIVSRVVSLICQIIIGNILMKEDFGVVGIAQSIASFVSVIQLAGLPEILVQRQKRFRSWANAAFWMSVSIGGASALLVAAIGPLVAWKNDNPVLIPIMALVGLQSLLASLQILPNAILQIQMRLRAFTSLNIMLSMGGVLTTALLALAGMRAYSLVLGPLIATLIVLAISWHLTRPRIAIKPQLRRWKYLWGDSALLLATGFISMVWIGGAVFMLGLAQPEDAVGVYNYANMLSVQTQFLIIGSLNWVFFPTLSKLQGDPARMLGAFLRVAKVTAMVGVPACFLQGICAPWFIQLIFKDRWNDAVPAVVLLSFASGFGILSSLPNNLLKAAGMYAKLFWITLAFAAFYLAGIGIAVFVGARVTLDPIGSFAWHPASLVALAVLLVYAISGPGGAYFVARCFGGRLKDILQVFIPPALCASFAVGAAYLLASAVPEVPSPEFLEFISRRLSPLWLDRAVRMVVAVLATGAIYTPLAYLFMRDAFTETRQRLSELGNKFKRKPARQ